MSGGIVAGKYEFTYRDATGRQVWQTAMGDTKADAKAERAELIARMARTRRLPEVSSVLAPNRVETRACLRRSGVPNCVALAEHLLKVVPSNPHELRPWTLLRRRAQSIQPGRFLIGHGPNLPDEPRPRPAAVADMETAVVTGATAKLSRND